MKQEIRERLEKIRSKYEEFSYQDLEEIDWLDLEPIEIGSKKYFPSVWSEKQEDERMLLVVQLKRWIFLRFIGETDCIGFLSSKNGDIELVDENYLMNEIGHP